MTADLAIRRRVYHLFYYHRRINARRATAREQRRLFHLRRRIDKGRAVPLHRLWPRCLGARRGESV